MEDAYPSATARTATARWVKVAIAAAAIVFVLVTALVFTDIGPRILDSERWGAYAACKEYVSAHLSAPSSAQFISFRSSKITRRSDREFTVDSAVDAKNVFGVMIRNEWACYYRNDHGDWEVDAILFGKEATQDAYRRSLE